MRAVHERLTKPQKHALREAAQLAHECDRSMSREDRDVYYLEASTDNLPLIVAGAVAKGIIQLDAVGEAARPIVEDLAARLAAFHEQIETMPPPIERDPYDPQAVVSLSAIMADIDMATATDESALYVNTRTGEVFVSLGGDYDDEEIDPEEEPDWVFILDRYAIDDMHIMKKFARNAAPAASRDLFDALSGRGAYRRFRDVIARRGLQKEWDAWREQKLADLVRSRLEERKIPFRR